MIYPRVGDSSWKHGVIPNVLHLLVDVEKERLLRFRMSLRMIS